MNGLDLQHGILLAVGLLALAKAIWALASPESIRRFVFWWHQTFPKVRTLMALLYVAIALAVWAVILVDQPLSNWLLGLIGLCCAVMAVLVLNVDGFRRFLGTMVLDRGRTFIRVYALLGLLFGCLLIWVAVMGR